MGINYASSDILNKKLKHEIFTKIKINVVINFHIKICIPILNSCTKEEFCFLGQLLLSFLMTFLINQKKKKDKSIAKFYAVHVYRIQEQ